MDPEIFKAYDIRGKYPEQIDERDAEDIAYAYVSFLREERSLEKMKIVVGRDMRLSSPALAEATIKGLREAGSDVIDIGLCSTPTFYFAVGKLDADGGIQVSASHNPKEYNGMKIVSRKAYPVCMVNGFKRIRDIALQRQKDKKKIKEQDTGYALGKVSLYDTMLDECAKFSLNLFDFQGLRPCKVVADPANSMGAYDLEALFSSIPGELVRMNFKLDGTFPAHQPDPLQDETLGKLKERITAEKADLGIATDGDGDRIFFIDEKGKTIEPGIIRGMLAGFVLKHNPGANIGYDARPGMITRDMIIENKGKPFITKVGHSLIKMKAIEMQAPFAGESSGHFYFSSRYGTYEFPMVTSLIILKIMSGEGKPISEIIRPLQRYFHSGEINSTVKDKDRVFSELERLYRPGAESMAKIDGISIEHKDYWFNVRASNTEPLVRLNLEARDKETMQKKTEEILALIRSC